MKKDREGFLGFVNYVYLLIYLVNVCGLFIELDIGDVIKNKLWIFF